MKTSDRFIFRAWDTHSSEMILPPANQVAENEVITFNGDVLYVEEDIKNDKAKVRIFIPGQLIVMQSTGLKDKNGRLIFEGDIVVGIGGWKEPMEIKYGFHEDASAFKSQIGFNIWEDDIEDLEVIGNIFENPELLQQNV